jgi:hypothetical protein
MTGSPSRTPGPLKALLVLPWRDATWVKEMDLPFAPFPGLGIRVDVYEILNVESVVVGDFGHDVTCIVSIEVSVPSDLERYTEARIRSFGFEKGIYP